MAYSSFDDYINKSSTLGQILRVPWNKNTHPATAAVAGEMSCLLGTAGNPTNNPLNTGTNRSFQSLCRESVGALMCPAVATGETMTILEAEAFSAAATVAPCVLRLVDFLGFYPVNNLTLTGAQATIQSTTFTTLTFAGDDTLLHAAYDIASFSRVRLTNSGGALPAGLALLTDYWTVRLSATQSDLYPTFADAVAGTNKVAITGAGTGTHTITVGLPRAVTGAGVDCLSAVTTVLGAGTPTVALTYTDHAGNLGNVTPTGLSLPVHKTAAAVGLIPYSGTGAGKYQPYFPRATGDAGVRSIESINQSVTQTSGALAYLLCKELASIPIGATGLPGAREYLSQVPSLPPIEEGACLGWLLYNGAATPANSGIIGHVGIGWG